MQHDFMTTQGLMVQEIMKRKISHLVSVLRNDRGWSLDKMGEKIGLSRTAVSYRESGDYKKWPQHEREQYANAFGMTLDEFDGMCSDLPTQTKLREPVEEIISQQEADRRNKFIYDITPTAKRISKLHQTLSDEIPPRVYEERLLAIAEEFGVSIGPYKAD